MQEKYEQAIKETFEYLDKCIADQKAKNYSHLGLVKDEIIERQMKKRGFRVKANHDALTGYIIVCPHEMNLSIHLWKEK